MFKADLVQVSFLDEQRGVWDFAGSICKGVKFHPWLQSFPANSAYLYPSLEVCAQEAPALAAALARSRDHLLAHVYARHARAALNQCARVTPGAAAHVKNLFAAYAASEREHRRQFRVVADGVRLVLAVAASYLVVKFLDRFSFHH